MVGIERLGRTVAHRPGFAENGTEETVAFSRAKMVLEPEEKFQSMSSKGDRKLVTGF